VFFFLGWSVTNPSSPLLERYGDTADRICEVLVLLMIGQGHQKLVLVPVDRGLRIGIVHGDVHH